MKKKQLLYLISWLKINLMESEGIIKQSKITHNYDRANQCEGMRNAYLNCLRRINRNQFA